MVRPRAVVGTIVWGEGYVRNWLEHALPSWLAPGNLPDLARHLDAEFRIYTREQDVATLNQYPIGHKLLELMPVKIHRIEPSDLPAVNVTHGAMHGAGGIVSDAHRDDLAVVYLTPDILWVNGSLGYIARSLAGGNVLVMAPEYRVVHETAAEELARFGGYLSPHEGRRMLLRHLSPLHACYHPRGQRVPDHCEILIWPVEDEGLLIYNMSRDTGFFWPRRVKYTPQKLPDVSNDFSKFDMVQDTNLALGLGLTPLAQNLEWLRIGKPFDSVRVAQFLLCFYTAYNDIRIRRPVRVPLVSTTTPHLWWNVEREASECFDVVALCVNAIATEDRSFVYPPAPPPLMADASPTDVDLCVEALRWLNPVIGLRFTQRVLEILESHPGGALTGYCSSLPTILPPRP